VFRVLLVSTGSNLLLMLVKLVLTFIMTPIMVRYLGNYDYGLWEMVMAVIGYMGMLNLGISPAISRFAAKYRAEGDLENLHRVFASSFVFLIAVGVVVSCLLAGWGLLFSEIMTPDGGNPIVYKYFMLILAGQLLIMFPGHAAESFLEGFQKYYVKNNITMVNSIVGAIVFIIYATPENALLLLAALNALGLIIKYVLFTIMLARPAFGAIRFYRSSWSLEKLGELLKFSFKSFIQGIATNIESATDNLVIGGFLGPAVVPFYSIPQNLTRYIQALGWTLSHAFMPMFSDLNARFKQDEIRSLYLVASKVVAGLVASMGLGMLGIGTPFLALWVGPEYTEQSDQIILLLVLFTAIPMLNPFSSRYLTAIDKHGVFAKLMPVSAAANLGLSILLVQDYGILGVAVGSLIPVLFLQPVILMHSCRHLGISPGHYLLESLLPLMFPLLAMSGVLGVMRFLVVIDSYWVVVTTVALAVLVYGVFFWIFSLKADEKRFVMNKIRKRTGKV